MTALLSFGAGFAAGMTYAAGKEHPFHALKDDCRRWCRRAAADITRAFDRNPVEPAKHRARPKQRKQKMAKPRKGKPNEQRSRARGGA